VSGRHGSWQVRRWAPTALSAVVALIPAGALLAAVAAAGSGYLLHRVDMAAAGAGTAALGLAVERLQSRSTRRRARRERWEHRQEEHAHLDEIAGLRLELADAHHTLAVLRSRIVTLQERAAVGGRPALGELAARQRQVREAASDDAPTMPLRRITAGDLPTNPLTTRPVAAGPGLVAERPTPAQRQRRRPVVSRAGSDAVPGTPGWRPLGPVPVEATGAVAAPGVRPAGAAPGHPEGRPTARPTAQPTGIPAVPPPAPQPLRALAFGPLSGDTHLPELPAGPARPVLHPAAAMLPPGPRDPVSGPLAIIVDARSGAGGTAGPRTPSPVAVDAMVYAALAEARADELTRTLERPGDPDRSGRHLGLADWDERTASGLVIVGASVVGDPQARARKGRHTA
jgi:hypothetical protein